MPLSPLSPILDGAKIGQYAVASFNVFNLDFVAAVLDAADRQSSPVVLAFAASHEKFVDFDAFARSLIFMAERAPVPVAVHLDHAMELGIVTRAIRAGFTSVMFDGYGLSADEKLRQTRSLTDVAHSVGITVEAEFGHITKAGSDESQRDHLLIDPTEVEDFVEASRIDVVAAAAGSVHGLSQGETSLDFDRLSAVLKHVPCFVSLHGGSGMAEEDIARAIALGVVKFSYFTGLSDAAVGSIRFAMKDGEKTPRITELGALVRSAVTERAETMMISYGSTGRA